MNTDSHQPVDAVRARIRRGNIEGEKVGNIWQVYMPVEEVVDAGTTGAAVDRQSGTVIDSRATDALVEQLRDERDYLRQKLDQALAEAAEFRQQAAAERERADVLQREALGRIEALGHHRRGRRIV